MVQRQELPIMIKDMIEHYEKNKHIFEHQSNDKNDDDDDDDDDDDV